MKPSKSLLAIALTSAMVLAGCGADTPPPEPPKASTEAAAPAPFKLSIDESKLPGLAAFSASDLSTTTAACTDLNAYVNENWLSKNPVPSDRTTWGSFEMLAERSLAVQKQIAEQLAAHSGRSGVSKLVGDIYASGMNEAAIEADGLSPIQAELDQIANLDSPKAIIDFMRPQQAQGQSILFGLGGESDFKNPDLVIAYVFPGGLGLPDKTYYQGDTHKAEREAYEQHIAATLKLGGASEADAAAQAKAIMVIETKLAEKSYSSEELARDVSKYYNPVTVEQAQELAPSFEWASYLNDAGLPNPGTVSLANPEAGL